MPKGMEMRLNYRNMFAVPKTKINITEKELKNILPKVSQIITQLNKGEGDNQDKGVKMLGWQDYAKSISNAEIERIKQTADTLRGQCEIIFIIGIGGSYLGPRAVIEAIYGRNFNEIISPKLYFIGNDTDPEYYDQCLTLAKGKKLGAIVISKSGTTTEPAMAFRFIKALIEKQHGQTARNRIIAITDAKKGALRKMAETEGYQTFVIPDDVGGRFSVITPVGLVPIAAAGINISEYILGYLAAKPIIDNPTEENPAAIYAALRFLAWQKGATVEYQVTNSSFMESNIFWTMQLEPESEGHDGHGIHVVPGVFPRDLHSIGQLIQQGPRNLIEVATKVMKARTDLNVPLNKDNLDELNYIPEKKLTLNDINKMTIDGPLAAHYADGVPNMTIEIPEISPTNIGKYHYLLMKATAIQGYLMGHNPFVQPGVQFWKDKLFAMAGKPGYEKQHKEYKDSLKNSKEKFAVDF